MDTRLTSQVMSGTILQVVTIGKPQKTKVDS